MKPDHEIPSSSSKDETSKKKKWWLTPIGILFLLALCDDDDDRSRRYCYNFGGERVCFLKPLPEDQFCYLEADGEVRCYDKSVKLIPAFVLKYRALICRSQCVLRWLKRTEQNELFRRLRWRLFGFG